MVALTNSSVPLINYGFPLRSLSSRPLSLNGDFSYFFTILNTLLVATPVLLCPILLCVCDGAPSLQPCTHSKGKVVPVLN
jgi:hypothetical protein